MTIQSYGEPWKDDAERTVGQEYFDLAFHRDRAIAAAERAVIEAAKEFARTDWSHEIVPVEKALLAAVSALAALTERKQ